jgi:hypothetical protein
LVSDQRVLIPAAGGEVDRRDREARPASHDAAGHDHRGVVEDYLGDPGPGHEHGPSESISIGVPVVSNVKAVCRSPRR